MRTQKTNDSIADAILRAIIKKKNKSLDEDDLTEHQREYLERLIFIDNLYRRQFPILNKNQIFKLYHTRFGLTWPNFVYDSKNCHKIFGTLHSPDKDYKRNIYTEWLEKISSLAIKDGDWKTAVNAIKTAAEINKLHIEDTASEEIDPAKYEIRLSFQVKDQEVSKILAIDDLQNLPITEFKELINMTDRPRLGVEGMDKLLEDE